jgi:hypothetical protein
MIPAGGVGHRAGTIPAAMHPRSQNADSTPQAIRLLRHCIARVQG